MNINKVLIALTFYALWQSVLAEDIWVQGESVSVEAKNCQGQDFVLLESSAGYLDLLDEPNFPSVGGISTLALSIIVGHPCLQYNSLQDSTKDDVPVSLELTLPAGIELSSLVPRCYFAAVDGADRRDVTAEASFDCTATRTPTQKIKLGSRNLAGGGKFLIFLPLKFSAEISETASYQDGTVRFALETPNRHANVVLRIPVAVAPLIRYPEPSVRFLEDVMIMDALIDTKGQAGQAFFEYARSDAPDIFDRSEAVDLAGTQGYRQIHVLFAGYVPGSYLWRVRFVTEAGESYVGEMQSFTTPTGTSTLKP